MATSASSIASSFSKVLTLVREQLRVTVNYRDIAATLLDFIKNFIVVGVIKFLADATGNVYLTILFYIGLAALIIYCFSYVAAAGSNLLAAVKNRARRELYQVLLAVATIGILAFVGLTATNRFVDTLSATQNSVPQVRQDRHSSGSRGRYESSGDRTSSGRR